MKRKVEFYNIQYKNFDICVNELNTNKDFAELLKNELSKRDTIEIPNNNNTKILYTHIIDISSEYIFGIVGKTQPLKDAPLKRFIQDLEKVKKSSDKFTKLKDLHYLMDTYTYFLINLSSLICASIYNYEASNFATSMEALLFNLLKNNAALESISIIPRIDEQFMTKLRNTKKIEKINGICSSPNNNIEEIDMLKNIFNLSSTDCLRYSFSIKLKVSSINQDTINKIVEYSKKGFTNYKVCGFDENEKPIETELIKHYLIKRIDLDFSEDELTMSSMNTEIKNKLINSLRSI